MPTTDLVTITFEGDARLTVLQILSVDRLLALSEVGRYIVVLNGEDNAQLQLWLLEQVASKISPTLLAKLAFVTAVDVMGPSSTVGWRGQQLIKLKVAQVVSEDHYLLLDAKNHFVHRCSIADFFDDDRPVTNFQKTNPGWMPYVRASLAVFNADDERAVSTPPTITPYVMVRSEVLALIDRLEAIYGTSVSEAFEQHLGKTTEFYLYYAHLVSSGRPYPYEQGPTRVTTLFTKWPQDPQLVMRLINAARDPRLPVFGLHRLRIPQLDHLQRIAVAELWRDELLKPAEDPEWFLQTAAVHA